MAELRTRFDWYEMTLDGVDDGRERVKLAVALDGRLARSKGRNGYSEAFAIERDGATIAQVYGRSARLGEVHIVTTSESCDEVVPALRRLFPDHRVSRADSAVDFAAPFEEIDRRVVEFAIESGISYRLISDSAGGATRYLGAPSSEVRVRVYKKTEQLRALHPEAEDTVPDGIVRFECQVRPGKRDIKSAVSRMHPDEVWGLASWSGAFANAELGIDAPRVSTHFRRPSDWQRALHYLGQQYGPMVTARAADVGTDVVLNEVLQALGIL